MLRRQLHGDSAVFRNVRLKFPHGEHHHKGFRIDRNILGQRHAAIIARKCTVVSTSEITVSLHASQMLHTASVTSCAKAP